MASPKVEIHVWLEVSEDEALAFMSRASNKTKPQVVRDALWEYMQVRYPQFASDYTKKQIGAVNGDAPGSIHRLALSASDRNEFGFPPEKPENENKTGIIKRQMTRAQFEARNKEYREIGLSMAQMKEGDIDFIDDVESSPLSGDNATPPRVDGLYPIKLKRDWHDEEF